MKFKYPRLKGREITPDFARLSGGEVGDQDQRWEYIGERDTR